MAAKKIRVSLTRQTVEAFEGAKLAFAFECVSGDSDHPTDRGNFGIFRKHHPHRSRTYGVQMNYAMFFTRDGKAFHQYHGYLPLALVRAAKQNVSDYLGSHGCVRLTEEDARALYEWAPVGTIVEVS